MKSKLWDYCCCSIDSAFGGMWDAGGEAEQTEENEGFNKAAKKPRK